MSDDYSSAPTYLWAQVAARAQRDAELRVFARRPSWRDLLRAIRASVAPCR